MNTTNAIPFALHLLVRDYYSKIFFLDEYFTDDGVNFPPNMGDVLFPKEL
jgi:hypothetical protein